MRNLWSLNTPPRFWRCQPNPPDECWQLAIGMAMPVLGLAPPPASLDDMLALVLGEGQFGPNHWRLGLLKALYYRLKPLLPRSVILTLRRLYSRSAYGGFPLGWPIEDRYARFMWDVLRQLLVVTGERSLSYTALWPAGKRFALVLTHDVETAAGQANAAAVADLDASYGFRSSFNFVPERYPLDRGLIAALRSRGCEVGVHGLNHNGRLFDSHAGFARGAASINGWLRELDAAGFRSPLTLRNPQWMQALQVEYDSSFFDTDPHEPMPGGTMSIWPFMLGHFVELPYTLIQDFTLTAVLRETTPRLWLEKVDFIAENRGMALLNTHPDYLVDDVPRRIYTDFLTAMSERGSHWHALPREVAQWWRSRAFAVKEVSEACLETYPAST